MRVSLHRRFASSYLTTPTAAVLQLGIPFFEDHPMLIVRFHRPIDDVAACDMWL